MASFEIATYRVGVHYNRGRGSHRDHHRRFLILESALLSEEGREGVRRKAYLYFFDDENLLPDRAGTLGGDAVVGILPLQDFRDIYQVLQSERPVFLHYPEPAPDDQMRRVMWVEFATTEEPVGEGPVDFS